MRKRKLPISIQTFRKLREEGCYYVDKTAYIHRLATEGTHYFLSRPRRFGKSLFVDTIKELFEGSEALFKGLHIHDRWDWSVRHPVVQLSFAAGRFDRPGALEADFADQMASLERLAGVSNHYATPHRRFAGLIEALHTQSGRGVVVLVDEYDRPITDALDDPTLAKDNRSFLRGVYGVVKDADALIGLSFFTGVTKFSKVSLFSDLNNLMDITLDPSYAAICGYTDDDLDAVFAAELEGLDRKAVRDWYDGYSWLGESSVYNPWAILLLFQTRRFKAHWFETGTPAFLVRTLVNRGVGGPALESEYATDDLLSAFDVEAIGTEALLFQAGYLTITDEKHDETGVRYRLGCPNREVRQSLNAGLLQAMSPNGAGKDRDRLRGLLEEDDLNGVEALFRAFFAGIPHDWHRRNDIAHFEGYYASVFYSHFAGAGLEVAVEESTSQGRLDMAVRLGERVFVFEFKMVAGAGDGSAMRQLKEKRYADKHRRPGESVRLVGVEFSEKERNIVRFDVERA